ncbi:MAG: aldo/keto reductase [Pseudomonadota bacterium]
MDLVRNALGMGINLIDTSEYYGTETLVGRAIRTVPRETLVLSSKKLVWEGKRRITPRMLRAGLQASLRRLGTGYMDIYHLHGVRPKDYGYAAETLQPELSRLKDEGKIRCAGISEHYSEDPRHQMLQQAVADDCWDVVMLGFGLTNSTARERVLPAAMARGTSVLAMAAASRSSRDDRRRLQFLVHADGATSLTDAAYRYCAHEPGIHSVLFGTGNARHLEENIASGLRPVLPESDLARLRRMRFDVNVDAGQL